VFVSGRKKDVIIVGGKNVYSQDIEALASEVPGVHAGRLVAFGTFSENLGTEDVVVVVESEEKAESDQRKLADAIRRHVTQNSEIALRRVEVVPPRWIIKTSSGKPARAANRDKLLTRDVSSGEDVLTNAGQGD
jgi:acyl-CoA synthetase (AMP-forming)/AMP-acid ligase II